jgi:hypothetical protein
MAVAAPRGAHALAAIAHGYDEEAPDEPGEHDDGTGFVTRVGVPDRVRDQLRDHGARGVRVRTDLASQPSDRMA